MYNRGQYVNKFYEKNLTTTVVTTSYYLGGTLVAQRENTTLRYTHQDHLSGTSLMTDTNGNSLGTMKYYPYGSTRSGSVPTDELFTGQKLDGTGLYYYGARYYDPVIGRFISPDTIIPYPANPQSYNRYSYCRNNPLKYVDPTGNLDGYGGYDYRDPNEYMLVIGLGGFNSNSDVSSGLEATQANEQAKPELPLEENDDYIIQVGYSAITISSNAQLTALLIQYGIPVVGMFVITEVAIQNQDVIRSWIDKINEALTTFFFAEHTKNSNPANRSKHEKGQKRKKMDDGGEKGDVRRTPRGGKRR